MTEAPAQAGQASTAPAHIVLDLYIGTFAAHRDAYVVNSDQIVAEPLTPSIVEHAFRQGYSVSGYMAYFHEHGPITTTVAAVDLDEGSLADGESVRNVLCEQGIPSLLVESRRGCHVWTLHTGDGSHGSAKFGPVPAAVVRRALTAAVGLAGLGKTHFEVFPKASASAYGVGALRLPLMPHPISHAKYPAYIETGKPITRVAELVDGVWEMTAPWLAVWKLSGGDGAEVPYPVGLGEFRLPRSVPKDAKSITDLLSARGIPATPGHTIKCPFHPDSRPSLSVAADDERCWCKSPSCDLYNGGRGMGSLGLAAYLRAHP